MWAARPHLASIFEKLLDQKTFCLPAACFTEHTLHYTNKKGAIPINLLSKIEPLLLKVQKPAQYIGGEMGSIRKDPNSPFSFICSANVGCSPTPRQHF